MRPYVWQDDHHGPLPARSFCIVFAGKICYYFPSFPDQLKQFRRSVTTEMRKSHNRSLCTVLVLTALLVIAAAEPLCRLSASEERIGNQIGFDKEILLLAKEEARSPLHRLSGYDDDGYQIMVNGLTVSVPRNRSEQVLWSLRDKLKPLKYMAFIVEINNALKIDKIGIIKGIDQYDILRVMYTNGEDDDVSHEEVIEKLKGWGKRFTFEIIGAENDWVEIEFRIMPRDLKVFADEIYDFSPDTVDEGTGSLSALIKEIDTTKRLMLWWN